MRFPALLTSASLALLAILLPGIAAAAPDKPNVILIFIDDMGYGDVNAFTPTKFPMPHLDRMAAEGMKFTDFYVNCAVCTRSRTALMTGCHYQRLNMPAVLFPRSKAGLHPDQTLIPEVLKPQGYATACFGKWHLGHMPPCLPTHQGFDEYFGIPYSNDMWIDAKAKLADDIKLFNGQTEEMIRSGKYKRNDSPLLRDDAVIEFPVDQSTVTRRYTEETVRFIHEKKDQPFFVYLPHTLPHLPLFVGEAFEGKSGINLFADICMELDWSVGEVLKAVKEAGVDEKTLVIFTTDNGTARGSSGPLRGKKGQMYEGGIRVPTIMRWPGKVPAGSTCAEVTSTLDVLPTLAALAGAELPGQGVDGHDIQDLMFAKPGAKRAEPGLVWLHGGGAVREGPWKYYPTSERGSKKRGKKAQPIEGAPKVQLYNLSEDLGEKSNVAEAHTEIVDRLHAKFVALKEDIAKNKRPSAPLIRE